MKKYKEILQKILTVSEPELSELTKERDELQKELIPTQEELDREKYLGSYASFEGSPAARDYFNLTYGC